MHRFFLALVLTAGVFGPFSNQAIKSGPAPEASLPGAFQALVLNGPFAGRQHSLVTEFRSNPVALVFVRMKPDGDLAETRKLLEALDKVAEEQHSDTGFETAVVFLSPDARGAATEEAKDAKGTAAQAQTLIDETVKREKLVNGLKELSKSFKRMIVACCPVEPVAPQFQLDKSAEVTVVVYARLRVYSTFGFGEGQLQQDGIDRVLKGIDDTLRGLKK